MVKTHTILSALTTLVAVPLAHAASLNITKRDGDNYFSGKRFTWYNVASGVTACGGYYQPSDYVVALNTAQYGSGYPGPQCWKMIQLEYNGVGPITAQVVDECPTCDWGEIDLSHDLFQQFGNPEVDGVVYGSWWFI